MPGRDALDPIRVDLHGLLLPRQEEAQAALIFSFFEVFGGYPNMPGGLAKTLLALVWTQYRYGLFPAVMLYFSLRLLLNDQVPNPELLRVYGN